MKTRLYAGTSGYLFLRITVILNWFQDLVVVTMNECGQSAGKIYIERIYMESPNYRVDVKWNIGVAAGNKTFDFYAEDDADALKVVESLPDQLGTQHIYLLRLEEGQWHQVSKLL